MKPFHLISVVLSIAILTLIVLGSCGKNASHPSLKSDSLAPIVPIREFVIARKEDSDFQISPDGKRIAWKTFDGSKSVIATRNVDGSRVAFINCVSSRFKWVADSRHMMVWLDQANGESGNIFIADSYNPATPLRNITQLTNAVASFVGRSRKSATAVYVQHNGRDSKAFDLYLIDVATEGVQKLVAMNPGNVTEWLVDGDVVRARVEQRDSARYLVLNKELNSENSPNWQAIVTWTLTDTMIPIDFNEDGKNLWVASDIGDDKVGLRKIDLATGNMQTIFADNQADLDIEDNLPVIGPKSKRPLLAVSEPDYPSIQPLMPSVAKAFMPLMAKGPVRISLLSIDDAETWATVKVFDGTGTKHFLLDMNSGRAELLAADFYSRTPGVVATTKPIAFMSRDGLKLHGYLTRPTGVVGGARLPMVVRIHGGPWYRNIWGNTDLAAASTQVQFLANRGYTVLEINFRGSTGYGRKFKDAGVREFGRKMQDDIVDGVRWSIAEGIADPDHIAIMGASYGGYSALMGMIESPEIFACGIAAAAPVDLPKMIESFPPSWELNMHLWYRFVGNPANPTDRAAMLSVSPISHVAAIRKPILLIHGLNDPLVNASQTGALAAVLKSKGKAVTYLPLADEGHMIVGLKSQLAMYKQIENFLAPCLGGRTDGFDYRTFFASP